MEPSFLGGPPLPGCHGCVSEETKLSPHQHVSPALRGFGLSPPHSPTRNVSGIRLQMISTSVAGLKLKLKKKKSAAKTVHSGETQHVSDVVIIAPRVKRRPLLDATLMTPSLSFPHLVSFLENSPLWYTTVFDFILERRETHQSLP